MRKKSRKLNCQVKWRGEVLSGKGSDKEVCSCGREPSCQVKWRRRVMICLSVERRVFVSLSSGSELFRGEMKCEE